MFRSVVLPVATTQPLESLVDEASGDEGQIDRAGRGREADNRQNTPRTHQFPHSAQTALGINMMEHGV